MIDESLIFLTKTFARPLIFVSISYFTKLVIFTDKSLLTRSIENKVRLIICPGKDVKRYPWCAT